MELGLQVYQPQKVRDPEFIQVMKELNPMDRCGGVRTDYSERDSAYAKIWMY